MRLHKNPHHGWVFSSICLTVVDRQKMHPAARNTYEVVFQSAKGKSYPSMLIIGTKRVGINVHFRRPWYTKQQKAMRSRLRTVA